MMLRESMGMARRGGSEGGEGEKKEFARTAVCLRQHTSAVHAHVAHQHKSEYERQEMVDG